MISAIVLTHNSARHLVRCLAPLVSGIADGLLREAIVADAGSSDETHEMAEAAGCTIVRGGAGAGVAQARADWVLILPAASMLEPGWIEEARRFTERGAGEAACFRFAREGGAWLDEALANAGAALLSAPRAEQGLLVEKAKLGARPRVRLLRTRVIIRR